MLEPALLHDPVASVLSPVMLKLWQPTECGLDWS